MGREDDPMAVVDTLGQSAESTVCASSTRLSSGGALRQHQHSTLMVAEKISDAILAGTRDLRWRN
jgi:hypothetical protein